MFAPLVEHHGGRHRGVKRLGALVYRYIEDDVTDLKRLLSYTRALIAHHKRGRSIKLFFTKLILARGGQAVDPKTFFFKSFNCLIYISYRDERNTKDHPSRRFDNCSGNTRLVVLGDKHTRDPEGGRGANDSADVVRILHLTQNHQRDFG